jgi:hypothetical protein
MYLPIFVGSVVRQQKWQLMLKGKASFPEQIVEIAKVES